MALLKSLAAFSAGAASLFAVSFAGDIAACPDEYPIMATDYVESSLVDARGARVQIVSEPYRVSADVSGKRRAAIRSRSTGATSGYCAASRPIAA